MNPPAFANPYEELALRFERQQEVRQRDNCLLLAADAALVAGRIADAERLRRRLLQLSPHHLLRPYPSLADALQSRDIQDYVADLRRQLPPEEAEQILHGANGKSGPGSSGRLSRPVEATAPRTAEPPSIPAATPAHAPVMRREPTPSPYARFEVPLPPGPGYDAWSTWFSSLLFFVVFTAALGLAVYVLLRPFL